MHMKLHRPKATTVERCQSYLNVALVELEIETKMVQI